MTARIITAAERGARKTQMRGLGDLVARVTKAVGIKPCGPCNQRRAALNKAVPFHKVDQPTK